MLPHGLFIFFRDSSGLAFLPDHSGGFARREEQLPYETAGGEVWCAEATT
jgi:hypothetical protein